MAVFVKGIAALTLKSEQAPKVQCHIINDFEVNIVLYFQYIRTTIA